MYIHVPYSTVGNFDLFVYIVIYRESTYMYHYHVPVREQA